RGVVERRGGRRVDPERDRLAERAARVDPLAGDRVLAVVAVAEGVPQLVALTGRDLLTVGADEHPSGARLVHLGAEGDLQRWEVLAHRADPRGLEALGDGRGADRDLTGVGGERDRPGRGVARALAVGDGDGHLDRGPDV